MSVYLSACYHGTAIDDSERHLSNPRKKNYTRRCFTSFQQDPTETREDLETADKLAGFRFPGTYKSLPTFSRHQRDNLVKSPSTPVQLTCLALLDCPHFR